MKNIEIPVTYATFIKETTFYGFLFFFLLSLTVSPLSPLIAFALFLFFPILVASTYKFKNGGFWSGLICSALYLIFYITFLSLKPSPYFFLSLFLVLVYPLFGRLIGQSAESLAKVFNELEQHRLNTAVTAIYTKEYLVNLIRKYIKEYERYNSNFSIVLLEIESKALNALTVFRKGHILSEVGSVLRRNIRAIDEIGRYENQFLLVLPHTGVDGGKVVEERVKRIVVKILNSHGCPITEEQIYSVIVGYPENKEGVQKLLSTLEEPLALAE
jgi:diguanylate cyclase (GGDEF)-like protein